MPMEHEPPSPGDGTSKGRPAASRNGNETAAKTLRATRSFQAVTDDQPVDATGFFKPLSATGRLERVWASFGLTLGRRLAIVLRDDHIYLILMAAVVGVTSGAAAALLLLWIDRAFDLFPHPGQGTALRSTVVIAVPVIGGLLAGGIRVFAARFLGKRIVGNVPGVMEAVSNRGGQLGGRSGALAGVGTGFTIASGGSVGHEGASVAIGATVGSVLARFFGLRMRRQVAMVGAGCAAGLAAAFNAPLAGVIFTVELVFRGSIGGTVGTMSVFIPLIVAAVAGTLTSHAIFGARPEFVLASHAAPGLTEMAFYLVLALAAGLIGTFFTRAVIYARERFDRAPWPPWIKPAVGGLGVGVLAAASLSNEVLGTGRSAVDAALHGSLAWDLALLLLGFKIVATALTMGSGGFGGVFMPSLLVGTCLGTLVGTGAQMLLGTSAVPDVTAYALVGMGAIFGAMMHAPLTPIVMIFELTQDYGIILPLMLSCILASLVARRLGPLSFYRAMLRYDGVVLRSEVEESVMKRGQVSELMAGPPDVLTRGADLAEIRKVCLDADLASTFVVDEDGAVVGFIDGNQLARRMLGGAIDEGSSADDLMGQRRLTFLHPGDTLAGAMLAFARSGHEVLPVVGADRRLVGMLRRGDLLAHYSDQVLGTEEEIVGFASADGPGHEVGLGQGVVMERVVVGRGWAGKTLAQLDLRGRTGAVVFEWRRGEEVLRVEPRAPLREGDLLALVGTREAILRTRRA